MPEDGGVWVLSDRSTLHPSSKLIPPISNSGFAFVAARNTFHALSERHRSLSYAIVFEFPLGENSKPGKAR
jgi:hypothetical protein